MWVVCDCCVRVDCYCVLGLFAILDVLRVNMLLFIVSVSAFVLWFGCFGCRLFIADCVAC